jgi:hypothetical protein
MFNIFVFLALENAYIYIYILKRVMHSNIVFHKSLNVVFKIIDFAILKRLMTHMCINLVRMMNQTSLNQQRVHEYLLFKKKNLMIEMSSSPSLTWFIW